MSSSLSNFTYYFSRHSLSSSPEFHRRASPVSVKSLSSLNLRILTGKYLHREGVLVRAEDKARGSSSASHLQDPLKFVLAAGTGTLFLVALIVLRIYQGWSYVRDMLLSAVIPYEESGWYDGQMWVKPPEILARDRLLGSYKVKSVIKTLKQTLVGTGALLVSKEEFLSLPPEVLHDDDLAAAAARAADGSPVYCRDRFYRAFYSYKDGIEDKVGGFSKCMYLISVSWNEASDNPNLRLFLCPVFR